MIAPRGGSLRGIFSFGYSLLFLVGVGFSVHASTLTRTHLAIQNSEYVSSGTDFFRQSASPHNRSISLTVNEEGRWSQNFGAKLHILNDYSATENWNYVKVYEGFGSYRINNQLDFYVGRKLETWMEWDDNWNLGTFQPRHLENRLHPETVGLTGFFLKSEGESWHFDLGILPINLPDFGPRHFVENNRIESRNPWFKSPVGQFRFQGETGDIHYSLNKPDAADVVLRPGAVAKTEYVNGYSTTRFTVTHKPMPQFLFAFPYRLVVGPTSDYLDVEIHPRLVYHTVAGLEQSGKVGDWTISGSYAYEHPWDDFAPQDWMVQQISPASIVSVNFSRPLEEEGIHAARVSFGALRLFGGHERDKGEFAKEVSKFEHRYDLFEAYSVALSWSNRGWFRWPLQSELRVIFDRLQQGGAITYSTAVNLSRDMRVFAQLDILGVVSEEAEIRDGFFSTYRANDRWGMGMSYVF